MSSVFRGLYQLAQPVRTGTELTITLKFGDVDIDLSAYTYKAALFDPADTARPRVVKATFTIASDAVNKTLVLTLPKTETIKLDAKTYKGDLLFNDTSWFDLVIPVEIGYTQP